jgi:hypothetical protein
MEEITKNNAALQDVTGESSSSSIDPLTTMYATPHDRPEIRANLDLFSSPDVIGQQPSSDKIKTRVATRKAQDHLDLGSALTTATKPKGIQKKKSKSEIRAAASKRMSERWAKKKQADSAVTQDKVLHDSPTDTVSKDGSTDIEGVNDGGDAME